MLVGGGVLGMLFLVNEMPTTQVREEVINENRYILGIVRPLWIQITVGRVVIKSLIAWLRERLAEGAFRMHLGIDRYLT